MALQLTTLTREWRLRDFDNAREPSTASPPSPANWETEQERDRVREQLRKLGSEVQQKTKAMEAEKEQRLRENSVLRRLVVKLAGTSTEFVKAAEHVLDGASAEGTERCLATWKTYFEDALKMDGSSAAGDGE